MSDVPAPSRASVVLPSLDELWPGPGRTVRPAVLAGAVVTGVLAALVLPGHPPGVGALLVLLALTGVAAGAAQRPSGTFTRACVLGVVSLCYTVVLRDAAWVVALCVLAAGGLGVAALCRARTVAGLAASALAVPLAAVRAAPWAGRGLTALLPTRAGALVPVVRTGLVTVVLVLAFGSLFASADALFAEWVDLLLPEPSFQTLGRRLLAFGLVAPVALMLAYVAAGPPRVDRLAPGTARPVRRFEWAVPVGLVDLLFVVFLVAQLTTWYGGHAYLRRTTGLTYAEYVHQGFGQLVAATLLTLVVVAAAARKAGRVRPADRLLLRGLLGLLCVLTFVVVGSALYRLHLYEQAYGFTQLRLLVTAFEVWLGVLVLLLLVAGVRLSGGWLPRAALVTGAVTLLTLALLDPDGYVADHNVDRFERTGRVDWVYLRSLSADAVPALDRLPEPYRSCALLGVVPDRSAGEDLLGWNLARVRAREVLATRPVDRSTDCATLPVG